MIEVRSLDVSIGGHQVCRGLDFAVPAGKSLAILGRNGAGKSTLLATLAGLRAADGGQVRVAGKALHEHTPRELARLRGYCAQQQHDAFAATVLDTALVGRHPHLDRWGWESASDTAMAIEALQRTGLAGFETRQVQTLSGGERQRLAVATLLTQGAQLLMLDEPLSHLDLNHGMALLALLQGEAALGRTVLAVMHEPNFAYRHFDYTLMLFGDGQWACGASAEVIDALSLQRLYGHPLRTLQDNDKPWFIPE
ncbi:MAG: ABC transporter ATP-binding protein [Rhodocyclaceae bacterium]|jgi:iron complex transport system ATP-binding protein|nr:ABC transporter ATP-binding protein [Rhodocyclaceae bacterium]